MKSIDVDANCFESGELKTVSLNKIDARGVIPESWACIDCGLNTAPDCLNRVQAENVLNNPFTKDRGFSQRFNDRTEVYMVKPSRWKLAGMESHSGCLCVGCLEKRLGRTLRPKDFAKNHPLNGLPGTERLRSRRSRGDLLPYRSVT